mmetsp:Transcript_81393/g.233903  ORF Transcript_81393/g.233903 Transcript_81393/m.233903 type:complete len:356 (+) Transcript_81393:53-1120(+)
MAASRAQMMAALSSKRKARYAVVGLSSLLALGLALTGARWATAFVQASVGSPNLRSPAAPPTARRATDTLDKQTHAGEYRLAVGHAIDVLRHDMVAFFGPEDFSPDFSIFSEDLVVADARVPEFELRGLATYQRVLSTLQWSLRNTCEGSRMEVTAVHSPEYGQLRMRWRLRIWPKDMPALAKGLFSSSASPGGFGEPMVVDGYTRYELDPWSGEIVKLTLDITNPPILLQDLIKVPFGGFSWSPQPNTARLPGMYYVENDMAPVAVATAAMSTVAAPSPPNFWSLSLPEPCEDDFQCNDGAANFPLECCDVPLLGKFCCKPPDFEPRSTEPAYVPLPVPSDPWQQQRQQQQQRK